MTERPFPRLAKVKLADLKPNPAAPRVRSAEAAHLAGESLRKLGMLQPPVHNAPARAEFFSMVHLGERV